MADSTSHSVNGGVHNMESGMDGLVGMDARRDGPVPEGLAVERPRERPSRGEAEQAVRTLIRWAGDDPDREGLLDTPARVARAYEEWFAGYREDPGEHLARTFEDISSYDEMVILRDIRLVSHCEHHMAPIFGRVCIGYLPRNKIVGISKLVRLVRGYARRLHIQEALTARIADTIDQVLTPKGVAVVIEGTHGCMTSRGVEQAEATMVTSRMLGVFRDRAETRQEFLAAIDLRRPVRSPNVSA